MINQGERIKMWLDGASALCGIAQLNFVTALGSRAKIFIFFYRQMFYMFVHVGVFFCSK